MVLPRFSIVPGATRPEAPQAHSQQHHGDDAERHFRRHRSAISSGARNPLLQHNPCSDGYLLLTRPLAMRKDAHLSWLNRILTIDPVALIDISKYVMIPKPLHQVSALDIQALMDNEVPESRTLEYKQALPGPEKQDKVEFLADVSCLANTSGGDLVYGIVEKRENGKPTGIPADITGVPKANLANECLRLTQLLQQGLDPRISGVEMETIDGFRDGPVLILRVPKSWAGPHMVAIDHLSKFYGRHGAGGKYQMDVREIRAAFLAAEEAPRWISRFRDERVDTINKNRGPVPVTEAPRVILHAVPMAAASGTRLLDVAAHRSVIEKLRPLSGRSWSYRFNFDGHLTYTPANPDDAGRSENYIQVFRSGAIEAVEARMLTSTTRQPSTIPFVRLERRVIETSRFFVSAMRDCGIPAPIYLMLTITGAQDHVMEQTGKAFYLDIGQSRIGHQVLPLPEVIVEGFTDKMDAVLRPVFDTLWQACGHDRCPSYDENGNWTEI